MYIPLELEVDATDINPSARQTVDLTYRGVKYARGCEVFPKEIHNLPNVGSSLNEVIGKYRGAVLRVQNNCSMPTVLPSALVNLKYRGINY